MRTAHPARRDFFRRRTADHGSLVIGQGVGRASSLIRARSTLSMNGPILPDLVAALVRLPPCATAGRFETFGFSGHAVTGREFVVRSRKRCGATSRSSLCRWLIHALRAIVPILARALRDGLSVERARTGLLRQAKAAIGDIPHTGLDVAVARHLRDPTPLLEPPFGLHSFHSISLQLGRCRNASAMSRHWPLVPAWCQWRVGGQSRGRVDDRRFPAPLHAAQLIKVDPGTA